MSKSQPLNSISSTPEIQDLANKLLTAKGVDQLSPAEQEVARSQLYDLIDEAITVAIVRNLPENSQNDFDKLLDEGAEPEVMQEFIQKNVPDLEKVIAAALVRMSEIYLQS